MKLHQPMIHALFFTSLCFSGVGCSLGTEVGNGFKPGKDGGGDSRTQMPKKAFPNDSTEDIATDGLFERGDAVISSDSGMGSAATVASINSKTSTESIKSIRPISRIDDAMLQNTRLPNSLVDLAMTGCASPLYGSGAPSGRVEFSLAVNGDLSAGKISVTASADGKSWDIIGTDPLFRRTVTLTPEVTVKATSANGAVVDVPSYSSCEVQSITTTTSLSGYSGAFRKITQKLATSKGNTYLTWYVQEGAGDYITRLKRIELDKFADAQQAFAVFSAP
ncbi:MAG: hypothetical protein FJ146_05355 [Deltaproteobacteria bacterium]|nr:hypothetical protein [Deltaproteobacteria bacterium]